MFYYHTQHRVWIGWYGKLHVDFEYYYVTKEHTITICFRGRSYCIKYRLSSY